MSKTFNMPLCEWRRQFYASSTGAPTIKALKEALDKGELPGGKIAGKYHISCKANYQPDYSLLEVRIFKPDAKPKITNSTAAEVLGRYGIQH